MSGIFISLEDSKCHIIGGPIVSGTSYFWRTQTVSGIAMILEDSKCQVFLHYFRTQVQTQLTEISNLLTYYDLLQVQKMLTLRKVVGSLKLIFGRNCSAYKNVVRT